MESTDPYDVWFRERLAAIHGLTPEMLSGPPPAKKVFDWPFERASSKAGSTRPGIEHRGDGDGIIPHVDEPDHLLVARLAAGDDDAIGEVFDRYGALVFGIARRVSQSVTTAEEVVQDVLTSLWRNPAAFDPARGSLRAYLGVQAHRRAVDAVRTDVRRRAREERREVIDLLASSCSYDELDRTTAVAVIHQAIGRLPPEQRRAVELAFWAGYTHRQVAEALGIPEGTAKSRLRLAQAKLSQLLASFNLEKV